MRPSAPPPRLRLPAIRLAPEEMTMSNGNHGTTTLHLVLAWGFVGIPLVWGVLQTLANAMALFR